VDKVLSRIILDNAVSRVCLYLELVTPSGLADCMRMKIEMLLWEHRNLTMHPYCGELCVCLPNCCCFDFRPVYVYSKPSNSR